ncbi:putative membrane protein [Breznakia sp. PF5-3]|uniref:hypothetical protein n=1 Tax=unclassified Breznakia TaxID=2623764 RepID=UPI0024055A4B|nr:MULTISPECIES: hypothetical protein [unclassified Breznakia]MDF9825000.1 putative membrane protein [Breznakia sp. PM6-1]MDF9835429.1 putative membrane protein [Breznakia sp. PF5-3]
MNKLKFALYRFMQGRYGNDKLNNFIFIILITLTIINTFFFQNSILVFLIYAFLIVVIFRTYSRNIYARQKENNKFLNLTNPVRKRFRIIKKNHQDKANKYYLCPHCFQSVRVPRGKGKIEIKCPKCSHHFTKKT